MFSTIKLELLAEKETFLSLDGQSKICNWLYNQLLEIANEAKKDFIETKDPEKAKTVYSKRGLRNLIPSLKKENPFLKSVHSSPLKNTSLRLSSAIESHQKGKKNKKPKGWPKFRSWQRSFFSLFYEEPNKGYKVIKGKLILSLGLGDKRKRTSLTFSLKEPHLLKNKKIKNLRIVKENNKYFAVFTVELKLPKKKLIKKVIAFDPNHKNFSYGVDSEGTAIEIEAPYWLKKADIRIDEIKSKRDKCQKKSKKVTDGKTSKSYFLPSKRYKKFDNVLRKALHKRQEQTKTFMNTLSHELCKEYDCIGIGDYTPHGGGITRKMRRAMNNRSLIGRFKSVLSYTTEKSGKHFIEYDEKGTTRTCNNCGYKIAEGIAPSIREWICPACKINHIRDENAALNGLKRILRDLFEKSETIVSEVPCSGLDFVKNRWAWCVLPSGVVKKHLQGKDCIKLQASGN